VSWNLNFAKKERKNKRRPLKEKRIWDLGCD
jgi:hypothetical protein